MVGFMRWRRVAALTLTLLSPALAACGSAAGSRRPDPRRWLSVSSSTRSATVTAVVSYNDLASGFNIDGANKGGLLFTVPSGWRVTVRCLNNAAGRRYACAIVRSPGAPSTSAPPTAGATAELLAGSRAAVSFASGPPTRYRIVATSEGHQPVGMWVTLEVTHSGAPSVRWVR